MKLIPHVYISNQLDPVLNLAVEEWLLRQHTGNNLILFIYRNAPSVIFGRNQNPWLESYPENLGNGIPLIRRISGGGTVYHDPGNVNFAFIMPRREYAPDRFLRIPQAALSCLGITAELTSRHNLFSGERKISGTAFMLTSQSALQHGTMLLNTDLTKLGGSLRRDGLELQTHAVRSVRSPVVNLSGLDKRLTPSLFMQSLVAAFQEATGYLGAPEELHPGLLETRGELADYPAKYRSWEWNYARTPSFVYPGRREVGQGQVTFSVEVRNGEICGLELKLCPECASLSARICQALLAGVRFQRQSVVAALATVVGDGAAEVRMLAQLPHILIP